ncbi:MAG: DNA-binding response regulator [Bacteroidetes bacterium GWF2_33_16]|nr:MAG: DNA-binding response regulator [Bacteroidetes bacterium GWE2_32_14]OFY04081.1 MAG: DNA-binding response regulator [Bacteroidetes bacterium GWF2_33_16]
MKLKCVIVDDEPLALTILEGYLKKIPYIEVLAKFESAIPVYEFLQKTEVDLLFLDIEMPNLSGVDFIRSLPTHPSVIFTTANKNYAIEGFNLNIDDYLLKPLTFERLLVAINRIAEKFAKKEDIEYQEGNTEFLYLKENKKMVKVYFDDLLYLESNKDYVKVVTSCKTVITKQQLSFFETKLNTKDFLRIHRSFIIAIKKIDAFSHSSIDIGKTELPIGRSYKDSVFEVLSKLSNQDILDPE